MFRTAKVGVSVRVRVKRWDGWSPARPPILPPSTPLPSSFAHFLGIHFLALNTLCPTPPTSPIPSLLSLCAPFFLVSQSINPPTRACRRSSSYAAGRGRS